MNKRVFPPPESPVSVPGGKIRTPFSLKAPAKINWFLQILGRRKDGYHNIKSLMQCVNLYDDLNFEHSAAIDVKADLDIPVHDNLVYKAVSLLKKYTSCRNGARISLKKNIPVGAGLGGGSSDAASTLLGLNLLWGLELGHRELSAIGAQLGSDVPFFLGRSAAALVEGRGDKIRPAKIGSSVMLLLVKPRVSVSTAWAYSSYDLQRQDRRDKLTKKPVDIKLLCQALNSLDFSSLSAMLCNDFDDVVVSKYPIVGEIRHRLLKIGAVTSAMSGSGSAVFGIFPSRVEAMKAVRAMKPNFSRVVETIV